MLNYLCHPLRFLQNTVTNYQDLIRRTQLSLLFKQLCKWSSLMILVIWINIYYQFFRGCTCVLTGEENFKIYRSIIRLPCIFS